ncbi:hypothetical protein D3C77_566100 [compost metagenome]
MIGGINLGLSDADVRHGNGGTAVIQCLADQLNGRTGTVHQPTACLAHGVRAQLQAHFVTYGLEGIRYCHAAYRLALCTVTINFK